VNLLLKKTQRGQILTFRQADLLPFLASGWVSNFDPEAERIFLSKDTHVLKRTLEEMNIDYLHIPNYYWPSLYASPLMDYLIEPKSIRPLIPLDKLWNGTSQESQLFVNEDIYLKSSCTKKVDPSLYSNQKKFTIIENLLSFFSGIPAQKIQKLINEDRFEIRKLDLVSKSSTQIIIGSQSGEQWEVVSNPSFVTLEIQGKNVTGGIHSLKVSSDLGVTWISLMETNGNDSSFRLSGQFKMGNFKKYLVSISSNKNLSLDFKINSIQVCEWW